MAEKNKYKNPVDFKSLARSRKEKTKALEHNSIVLKKDEPKK